MGLAPLIVVLQTIGLWKNDERYRQAARFWAKIFGINFVARRGDRNPDGIPVRHQLGALLALAGGVIGQTLAMEGIFAFFLESAFLGLFLFGEKRLSRSAHWFAAFMVFVGSWLSGYFIVATDAWMQHPVAYHAAPTAQFDADQLLGAAAESVGLIWQYAHNMSGAVMTGAFVMAALGAFYLLSGST